MMTDPTTPETERDAERYRRLRVLGCAPAYTQHLTRNEVLRFTNLDAFVDEDIAAYPSRGEAKPGLAQCPDLRTALDEATGEITRLRAGLQRIVDFKTPLPRAVVREACAELLAASPDTSTVLAEDDDIRALNEEIERMRGAVSSRIREAGK